MSLCYWHRKDFFIEYGGFGIRTLWLLKLITKEKKIRNSWSVDFWVILNLKAKFSYVHGRSIPDNRPVTFSRLQQNIWPRQRHRLPLTPGRRGLQCLFSTLFWVHCCPGLQGGQQTLHKVHRTASFGVCWLVSERFSIRSLKRQGIWDVT